MKPSLTRVLLVITFVVVPIAEIYVLIQVGQWIGTGPTIMLLFADAILGGWLMKREAFAAFRAINQVLESGRMPTKELADGALVVFGGALLISPGFITDILGFFLILPLTRPVARRLFALAVKGRVTVVTTRYAGRGRQADPDVVVGEVVNDEPPPTG